MNGFLLLAVYAMDDLPCGLYATREEAELEAETIDAMQQAWPEVLDLFDSDASVFYGTKIVEFSNGRPVRVTVESWIET